MWPTRTRRTRIRQWGVATLAFLTAIAFSVVAAAQPALAQPLDPSFSVRMVEQEVHGFGWEEAVNVTVAIDDPGTPEVPDWDDTQLALPPEWDPSMGFVQFRPYVDGFVIEPGFVVTMTQVAGPDTYVRTHTVTSVTVTDVNEATDVVSGTGAEGAVINVSIWDEFGTWREVTVVDGVWTADFGSGPDAYDIAPGTQGEASEHDGQGNNTQWYWSVPNPAFSVETPGEIWSTNDGWIPGRTVTLTVDDDNDLDNGHLYEASTVVQSWGPSPWEAGWNFSGFPFPIVAGHYVTAADGIDVTKVLHVLDLTITDIDEAINRITGTAPAGTEIHVHACAEFACEDHTVVADGSNSWVADFTIDIEPGFGGAAQVYDADGDSTHRGWQSNEPYFGVDVANEEMWAANWPAGETLTFQVFADETSGDLLWTDTMTVFGTPWQNTEAGYRFWGEFDIIGGLYITVTDGVTAKDLVVSSVSITEVDPDDDFYGGTVDPTVAADVGTEVCAWARMLGDLNQGVQLCDLPDPVTGTWTVDFSGVGDIIPGDHLGVSQFDVDGDETRQNWGVPPWIYVELAEKDAAGVDLYPDRVGLEQWIGPVDIFIGETEVMSDVVTNGEYVQVDLDVEIGDIIRVVDSHDDKTLLIEELSIDDVTAWDDPVQPSTAFGTAAIPDNTRHVQVTASADYGWWTERWVPVVAEHFEADFANPGNGWRESEIGYFGEGGADDIYLGGEVRANLWDFDNDQVQAIWHTCNPRIIIVRNNDRIEAVCFPEGSELVVELDDPAFEGIEWTSGAPVVVTRNPDKRWETLVVFELGEYTAPDAAVVTATATNDQGDPIIVVETQVIPFSIEDVNEESDTITGTATEGSEVLVEADGNWRYPVADATNTWVADFSEPGDRPGEENPVDLRPGSEGGATLIDEFGSATTIAWRIANSQFQVSPADENISGNEFLPGALLTITVEGSAVPGGPYHADAAGNFGFGFDPAELDIGAGDVVSVSDGDSTKFHTVTDLAITGVDPDTDEVFGVAAPASTVDVWVHDSDAWRRVEVGADRGDGLGEWTALFTAAGIDEPDENGVADLVPGSNGNSGQCDLENDCTNAQWRIAQAQFQVSPADENISGNEFLPGALLTITVEGSAVLGGPYHADAAGNFGFGFDPAELDIGAGDVVTVSDGDSTKFHTVTDLAITGVDPDTDEVFGVAAPASTVDVWVHDSDAWRRVEVGADRGDGLGEWTALFTAAGIDEPDENGVADLVPGSNGNSGQCDLENDCTNAQWWVANPTFSVEAPHSVWSSNEDWELGDTITLMIDDPGFPGPLTTTVVPNEEHPGSSGWWFELDGIFEILPGHDVTVTDGEHTKALTVLDLTIESIDAAADSVSGRLLDGAGGPVPGVPVDVNVHNESGHAHRTTVTEADGSWSANFAVPGEDEGEQALPFDITEGTGMSAQVFDEDRDSTHRGDCFECDEGGYQIDPIEMEHGDVLISETDGTLWLYDPDDGSLESHPLPFGGVWDIQWIWEDSIFIANSADGKLWVLHLPSGELSPIEDDLLGFPIGMTLESSPVGWDPSALWVADGQTGILHFDGNPAVQVVDAVGGVDGIVVAPDGTVYFTNVSPTLFAVDETEPDNYRVVAEVDGYGLNGIVMLGDGRILATSMFPPALVTIDPTDGSYTVEDHPQLWTPEDSAIGRTGEVYVIDSGYENNFGDQSGLYVRTADGVLTQLISHHDYPEFGDTVDVLVAGPWVSVTKEASEADVFAPGEDVGFAVTVHNQLGPFGPVSLDSLYDDAIEDVATLEGCAPAMLPSGESYLCEYEVFVGSDTTNTVTASWTDDWGHAGESTATAHVDVVAPLISMTKTAADEFGNEGDAIGILVDENVNWRFVVTNEGDVHLIDVSVVDDGIEVCGGDLAPGEMLTCSSSATAEPGWHDNTATVTAIAVDRDGDTMPVAASDGSSYFGLDSVYVSKGGCEIGEFDLVFTPDMQNWPGHYKLSASNPGQFFMNTFVVTDGTAAAILEIPYPFVTQGAQPLHDYGGVTVAAGPCFEPVGDGVTHPAGFGLADYTDTNDDGSIGFGDVYRLEVNVTEGFRYLRMHLDYGLKKTNGWIGNGSNAFNDADLNPDLPGVAIIDSTDHRFAMWLQGDAAERGSIGVVNHNEFKEVKGFGGLVLADGTDTPVPGVRVALRWADGTPIETMTTDEHGWFFSDYRHTGKTEDYFIVLLGDEGGDVEAQLVTVGRRVKFGGAVFYV